MYIWRKAKKKYHVVTWYRPPSSNSDLFTKFEDNLEMIDGTRTDLIILGNIIDGGGTSMVIWSKQTTSTVVGETALWDISYQMWANYNGTNLCNK